jgi:hypothetical protein
VIAHDLRGFASLTILGTLLTSEETTIDNLDFA